MKLVFKFSNQTSRFLHCISHNYTLNLVFVVSNYSTRVFMVLDYIVIDIELLIN
jgi:hypothetical protein